MSYKRLFLTFLICRKYVSCKNQKHVPGKVQECTLMYLLTTWGNLLESPGIFLLPTFSSFEISKSKVLL